MLRLLEPRRPEAERYAPYPEHALGNGRPRSVVLTGRRAHHKSILDTGNVESRPAAAGSLRPASARRASRPASAQPARAEAQRRDNAQSSEARRMQDAMWTDTSGSARAQAGGAGVIERDDATVPGLELSGVSPEDLDDAGILYDEEQGLLGAAATAALAATQCSTGGSEQRSTQHSDGGGAASRTGSGAGDTGTGSTGGGLAGRPSVRMASGSGEASRLKRAAPSAAAAPLQKVRAVACCSRWWPWGCSAEGTKATLMIASFTAHL